MNAIKKRIVKIIKRLRRAYPSGGTFLKYNSAFQILIATILSAQCTDKRTGKVASYILKRYKDANGFSKAKLSVLEREIRPAGLFRHKAKNIIATSKKILRDNAGKVPDTMEGLTSLPGVGRKTANIVLSNAFKKVEGIAVDTHVKRLSNRLGLSSHDTPDKVEQDLLKIIPKRNWLDFNYLFVTHGKTFCKAKGPLHDKCPIRDLCPYVHLNRSFM